MRVIVIAPLGRAVFEHELDMAGDYVADLRHIIGTDTLIIDAAPPHSAMFLDALGMFREDPGYWRAKGVRPPNNVAGIGVLFGVAPDGRLTDVPAAITADTVLAGLDWVDERVVARVETVQIVETGNGPAPQIHRDIQWSVPAPSVPVAAPAKAAPAEVAAGSIWAIHETEDGRYRVLEYEVTAKGLGPVNSLTTVPNLETARERVPKGLAQQPAGEDAADDTLIETWA